MENETIQQILIRLEKLERLESLQIEIAVIKSKLSLLEKAAYTIAINTFIILISSIFYFITHVN